MMTVARAADLPQTGRDRAAQIASEELSALLEMLPGLTPARWRQPTDCAGWTVRDIVAHLPGPARRPFIRGCCGVTTGWPHAGWVTSPGSTP